MCVYVCICMYLYAYMCAYIYVCIYMYVYICMYIYKLKSTKTDAYICVSIHIYT